MAATQSRQIIRTVNPATGETLKEHPALTDEEALDLLARADRAFHSWKRTPLERRVELFLKAGQLAEERAEAFARESSLEMGRPLSHGLGEASAVPSVFRYYAENAKELLAGKELDVPNFGRAYVRPEPTGVVLGIEPWNAPLMQAMRAAVPNLMLGNTVILKPSSVTPATTFLFDELFADAGFPEDVYRTALLSFDQISTFIADSRVRGVTLTGSDKAGEIVGAQAGRAVKPAVLELGGSDAFIVLDSANLQAAVGTAVACRLVIGGQACTSPKRIIVTEAVADEFIAGFTAGFAGQKVGDPFDPETTVGPMATEKGADDLQSLYDDAVAKGATVLVPGGRVEGPGAYFKPAVITDVTTEMRVYHEEAFGPLGVIYRVPDADAAVALANDSVYGLGGSVFGAVDDAIAVAERIDTGSVAINAWLGGPVEVPFGGTKASGFGRELGPTAMDAFANHKVYAIT
ncbi:aldehyde dehydrogenase family protein [Streptomyces sp. NPDC001027]|uniref:aldehyde dehydrogenase family protein n=1 Tax=Streptomyces sp. NPDC001027 TaxID=3154771 RepID=UPI003319F2E2